MNKLQEITDEIRNIAKLNRERVRDEMFRLGDLFNEYHSLTGLSGIDVGEIFAQHSGMNPRYFETMGRVSKRVKVDDRCLLTEWTDYIHFATVMNPRILGIDEENFRKTLSKVLARLNREGYERADLIEKSGNSKRPTDLLERIFDEELREI